MFVTINIATPTAFPWAISPVAGMGLGLAVHWYFARAFLADPGQS